MSDKLKLSDPKDDAEVDRVASALEQKEDNNRIKQLEKNIAALERELAKQNASAGDSPAQGGSNKIGARKHGSFKAISTAPSINKTPIGPTMVPIPYPVVQDLSSSVNTARTVKFNGRPVYLLDGSTQPHCTGDEPGTGKGIKSGTVSGEVKPVKGCSTVRIEGKQVVREGDACTMNGGNNPGIYVTTPATSGAAPKDALATSNPPKQPGLQAAQARLKEWAHEMQDHLRDVVNEPVEGGKGGAKGYANNIPETFELLLKAAMEQHATEQENAALTSKLFGQTEAAKVLTESAAETRRQGERINLPKFSMNNAGQKAGDALATTLQLFAGIGGVVKGAGKSFLKMGKVSSPGAATSRKVLSATVTAKSGVSSGGGVRIVGSAGRTSDAMYRNILSRVSGKVMTEANALAPGVLGDDLKGLAGTFSGGRYATMQLTKPMKVYRAWAPGQSKEFGAFWSLEKPAGALQTRIDSGLLPEWGNIRGTSFRAQASQYTVVELPAGTVIQVGEVGSQGGVWVGGKSQILIDDEVQPAWKVGGGPLR